MINHETTHEPAHVLSLGHMHVRVFPDRNWLVLSRDRGGQTNTLGITTEDLTDAVALLRTADAWLADQRSTE